MSDDRVLEAIRAFLSAAGVDVRRKAARADAHLRGVGPGPRRVAVDRRQGAGHQNRRSLPAVRAAGRSQGRLAGASSGELGVKKMRFADADGAAGTHRPGARQRAAVRPPILPLELCGRSGAGRTTRRSPSTPGSLTTSIIMSSADYRRVCGARWLAFSQPPYEPLESSRTHAIRCHERTLRSLRRVRYLSGQLLLTD